MIRKQGGLVVFLLSVALAPMAASGCGQGTGQSTGAGSQARHVAHMPPLPEWAPKNPSPEFLRAARVLKPIPPEILARFGEASPSAGVAVSRYSMTLVPAYEFFGTLSDDEISRIKTSGSAQVPVKSMTRAQRRILDNYFEAWRKANLGEMFGADLLVELYKEGARQDLSNVDVGFVFDGHGVNMQFWITQSDGSVRTPSSTIAMM